MCLDNTLFYLQSPLGDMGDLTFGEGLHHPLLCVLEVQM